MTPDPSSSSPARTTPTTPTTAPTLAELRETAAAQRPAPRPHDWMETAFPMTAAGSAPVGLFALWLESTPGAAGPTNWWPIAMLVLLALWLLARVIHGSR
jgi:hypothetical protein